MRGLCFVLVVLGLIIPNISWSADEKNNNEETKGLLSILDFSSDKSSEPATKNEDTASSKESAHQQLLNAADAGDLNAQLSLGYIYLYGEGDIAPDYNKAFHYYNLAANQNNHVAINNLGSLYYSGIGTTVDIAKAMDLFEKAHKFGNIEAAVNLAFLYMTDNPRSKDSTKAISLFETAANANNPTAQFMLGYAYLYGFIVEQSYTQAFDLIQKSALAKYDEAQYQLALLYIEGKGVPQNYGKAVAFLDAAIAQGHLPAMTTLGTILVEGNKYPRNIYKAHILFNLASVYGVENAAKYRDDISKNIPIDKLLQAQAQADKYRPAPSELTLYIRQTFGNNITAYVDRYLPEETLEQKQEKPKPQQPAKSSNKLL